MIFGEWLADMLKRLSIRDVVVVDSIDLEFGSGLCVLTGETGAGKSILLDALSLALGRRADTALLRDGAETAIVTATFDLKNGDAAQSMLESRGIPTDDELVIRRTLTLEGRSRAFVNDQSVTVGFLVELGALLIEINGQNDRFGLLDPVTHRNVLDAAGNLSESCGWTEDSYKEWSDANASLIAAEHARTLAHQREAELRQNVAELEGLGPAVGEAKKLSDQREILRHASLIADALTKARTILFPEHEQTVDESVRAAHRLISNISEKALGQLDTLVGALERAAIELEEATTLLQKAGNKLDADPNKLSEIEERLFAIRELGRKYSIEVDELPELLKSERYELTVLESGDEAIKSKRAEVSDSDTRLLNQVNLLRKARISAAKKLDLSVVGELETLKMGDTKFCTDVKFLPREDWGIFGGEQVAFTVATIPGNSLGPIHKVASGGELSRFMLALRVAMASAGVAKTLVFDEIDAGTGGAVADSIGQRLAKLSLGVQVLVVTHQPQIAARAEHHFHVTRSSSNGVVATRAKKLTENGRVEEVARMLAGAEVTDEARAAAIRLMAEARV